MPTGVYQHKPCSEEKRQKISEKMKQYAEIVSKRFIGENARSWQGNKVNYRDLHAWVQYHLGKANHCENCGLDKIPKGKKRYFQWANISKQYKRNLNDWIQLCIKCHRAFDEGKIVLYAN